MDAGGNSPRATRSIALVLITAGVLLPACDRRDSYGNPSGTTYGSGGTSSTQPGYGSSAGGGGYYSHGVWINTGGTTWGRSGVASGSSESGHGGAASEGHGSSFGGFGAHGGGGGE